MKSDICRISHDEPKNKWQTMSDISDFIYDFHELLCAVPQIDMFCELEIYSLELESE